MEIHICRSQSIDMWQVAWCKYHSVLKGQSSDRFDLGNYRPRPAGCLLGVGCPKKRTGCTLQEFVHSQRQEETGKKRKG